MLRNRHLAYAIVVGLVLAAVTLPTPAKADFTDFVVRECHTGPACSEDPSLPPMGTHLLLNGSEYRFLGVNIYNANSNGYCGYPFSDASLDQSLNAINPHGGAIRAWFFQQLATTNGVRDWTAFDRTIAAARRHGFKVIATLVDQWGDCGASTSQGYGYKTAAWYSTGYQQADPLGTTSYLNWTYEIASRYKDDPTILAWQLVNEAEVKTSADGDCAAGASQILNEFATHVSDTVRSADPNHLISLGTIGSGQCGAQGTEYSYVNGPTNIDLCEYHDYLQNEAMPGDAYNGLQVRINQCNALDKPLFVGEMGIKPADVGGTLHARARAFEAKFEAQFRAGVVGALMWAWSKDGSLVNNYDIGPGDPALGVLSGIASFTGIDHFAISHDGRHLAVFGDGGLYLVDRDGTNARLILRGGERPFFTPSDQAIIYTGSYANQIGVFAVPVSQPGTPTLLTDAAFADLENGSLSPDGTEVVALEANSVNFTLSQLHVVDISSKPTVDTLIYDGYPTNGPNVPTFSVDGTRIVFSRTEYGGPAYSQLFSILADGDQSSITQLTHFTGNGDAVLWPEASRSPANLGKIAFFKLAGPQADLSIQTIDLNGANLAPALTILSGAPSRAFVGADLHWTPSGQLAYLLSVFDTSVSRSTFALKVPQVPLQPRTAPIAASGDGVASVSWLPPSYDGGLPITSYTVTASPGSATTTVSGSSTTATVSGLTNGVTHTFTVSASNAEGGSEPSLVSNAVTPQAGAATPATVQQPVSAGSTASTDPGSGPTSSQPITTSVTMPASAQSGILNITQSSITEPAPTGFSLVGQQVQISAPAGTPASPLTLRFSLDASATEGQSADTLQIYRTEVTGSPTAVADCSGAAGVASPDPCVSARTTLSGGDIQLTVLTSTASIWNLALDTTPPSITFATPIDGATYKLRQVVNASYSCADQGSGIASCSAPAVSGGAIDTGSVGTKTFAVTARDKAGNSNVVTHTYKVIFDFTGFFSPISNPPVLNSVKAGASVTESFSLAGNQGLSIIPPPYPKLQTISCTTLVASGPPTSLSGTLRYGSAAYPTRYFETWPSLKSLAGTCAQVAIRLTDGTDHVAYFKFTK